MFASFLLSTLLLFCLTHKVVNAEDGHYTINYSNVAENPTNRLMGTMPYKDWISLSGEEQDSITRGYAEQLAESFQGKCLKVVVEYYWDFETDMVEFYARCVMVNPSVC